MTEDVKVLVCPGGERIVTDEDDLRVQATALRLGVLEQLSAAVRGGNGQRGASVILRDGDQLIAVIRWAGFAKESNNGWASFAVKHRKPCLHLHAGETVEQCARRLPEFLHANGIRVLNVVGSRGSKEPEVGTFVRAVPARTPQRRPTASGFQN